MRIHHLNCATLCPRGGRLVSGRPGPVRLVCHCLLVETDDGLVLVDTGLGLDAVADPGRYLGSQFPRLCRPRLAPEETAARQIERLGYQRSDVRHVILTHLDLDHAGGLRDFPEATVHVHETEHEAAMARQTDGEKRRYRPALWAHQPRWVTYRSDGESWFGFEAVRDLRGLPPDILLIPLPGHTRGHSGVAVKVDGSDRWLLHAGDAYFFHRQITSGSAPLGLALFQRMMDVDRAVRRHNQARLRELARGDHPVSVFCAHDVTEYERMRAVSSR